MAAAPTSQHRWLHQLVGQWTWEAAAPAEPGKPPTLFTGTESVRLLGEQPAAPTA